MLRKILGGCYKPSFGYLDEKDLIEAMEVSGNTTLCYRLEI
jgi:hypothetical protein